MAGASDSLPCTNPNLMEAIWGVSQAYLTESAPPLIFCSAVPSEYTDREFSAELALVVQAQADEQVQVEPDMSAGRNPADRR